MAPKPTEWKDRAVTEGECENRHGRIRTYAGWALSIFLAVLAVAASAIGYAVVEARAASTRAVEAVSKIEARDRDMEWVKESLKRIETDVRMMRGGKQ